MLPTSDMKTCPLSSHVANIWNENLSTVVLCCQHLIWKLVHCRLMLPTSEMKTYPLSSHVTNIWNENLSTFVSCCQHLKCRSDKSVVSLLLPSVASQTDHWASTWDRKYTELSPCALSTNNRPSLCSVISIFLVYADKDIQLSLQAYELGAILACICLMAGVSTEMTFKTTSTVKLCQFIIVMMSQRDNTMRHDNALPVTCHSQFENWTSIHSFVPRDIATWMRHNNYLRSAIVRRSAARDVELWGRRYNIAIMSDVSCNVSDETLRYCKEFLEKYPEAPNWNETRIILLLTRITSFHVYVLAAIWHKHGSTYRVAGFVLHFPALRVTSNHAYVISL